LLTGLGPFNGGTTRPGPDPGLESVSFFPTGVPLVFPAGFETLATEPFWTGFEVATLAATRPSLDDALVTEPLIGDPLGAGLELWALAFTAGLLDAAFATTEPSSFRSHTPGRPDRIDVQTARKGPQV